MNVALTARGNYRKMRGTVVILLMRLGLPCDVARAIWELRCADYEATRWHVMGLHYRAGAIHWYISARPWRFSGRVLYEYDLLTTDHYYAAGKTVRGRLKIYIASHWAYGEARRQCNDKGDPRRQSIGEAPEWTGEVFAHAMICERVGVRIYFGNNNQTRDTLTDQMRRELADDLDNQMPYFGATWCLCGAPVPVDGPLPVGAWTDDMYVEYVHKVWMMTRPADR